MTAPKQSPKPADDVASMVEQLKAARPDRDPIYAAALMLEASDMLTRQAEREWSFCPECGSDKIHYQEGYHKQCGDCFQEWFSDVDYTGVVRKHLAKEYADSRVMVERANARAEAAEKRIAELEARLGEAVKVLDAILRAHNEGSGLIDCIDNAGERYTSRFLAETIETARAVLATLKEKHDADR